MYLYNKTVNFFTLNTTRQSQSWTCGMPLFVTLRLRWTEKIKKVIAKPFDTIKKT